MCHFSFFFFDDDRVNVAYRVKMERKIVHQVCYLFEDASDIAKQIVGLAGHSASPQWTALMSNVSLSTARFWTNVGLKAILRASCCEQGKSFFELAQNTPMAQTWKTKADILTQITRTGAQIAGSSLSAL